MDGLEDTSKRILEITKERVKVSIRNSFKNNLILTLVSIIFLIIYFLNSKNLYYLPIYFIALLMLYPFFSDLFFYASYYETWESVTELLFLNKDEKNMI
jgi:hypothetical protein